jgi:hypothetical protein
MSSLNPRRLTRQQISRVVGNDPELIKAFEALFAVTGQGSDDIQTLTVSVEMAQQVADTADARGVAALAQLDRIASALEMLSLAPAAEPPRPIDEPLFCPTCSALREEVAALARRISDLESR